MINYEFNQKQFNDDFDAVKATFFGMIKSFGPSPQPVGFFEEMKIRFMLGLVEMGISTIIRTVILIIVGLFLYFTFFRHSDELFKLIFAILFISYGTWLFLDTLVKQEKDGDFIAKILLGIRQGILGFFSLFKKNKKEVKKK